MSKTKQFAMLFALMMAAGAIGTSYARGGGGGGGGSPGGGGMSSTHMSAPGASNTNGPTSADRALGLDRAQDRMSEEGLSHEKALSSHEKPKSTKAVKSDGDKRRRAIEDMK